MNIQDELSLTSMILYGASFLESKHVLVPGVISLRYSAVLCQLIRRRLLVEASNPSSALINAVCGAIATNRDTHRVLRSHHRSNEISAHIQGLSALITAGGGWRAVEARSDALGFLMNWIDICFSGSISAACISNSRSDSGPYTSPTHPGSLLYMRSREFMDWYRRFHQAAAERQLHSFETVADPTRAKDIFSVSHLFQSAEPVYEIIKRSKIPGLRPIIPLLYAHIMVWHGSHSLPANSSQLYEIYLSNLQAFQVVKQGSLESLTWALIIDVQRGRIMYPQVLALLRGQLYGVSRLAINNVEMLEAILLDFMQFDPSQNLCPAWWTPEQFREIILHDLDGQ